MVGYDGQNDRQITFSSDSESSPRWSPDGKYLSFTSSRPGKAKGSQVWLLDRSGGEAYQLTELKGRLQGYEWSPDSKRLALVIGDPDPEAEASASPSPGVSPKPPKPIVIDRYRYKQDVQGYLLSGRHSYIYLYDIATKKLDRLTKSKWDESSPSWSPDSTRIAFMSNHADDPDRDPAAQLYVADAKAGVTEKQLTTSENRASRARPEWSSDGKWLVFTEGDEKKFGAYNMEHLMFVPADASAAPTRVKAVEDLDRGVSGLRFGSEPGSLMALVSDDRSVYPINITRNVVKRLLDPPVVVSSLSIAGSHTVLLSGDDKKSTEIYAMEGKTLRQLTHQNDALMSELQIALTEDVSFKSKDGTEVHGLLTYPVGYKKGKRVPLLLRIHGGPNGQDQHSFSFERQFFAANGYAVLAVNYRGSSGRGQKYSRAIFADWGHYEVEDLEAGVDHVIQMGVADADRLGVGVETQLVIYPNEFHGITRPSYVRDRYERYLAWYDKYVKKNPAPMKNVAESGAR